MIVEIRKMIIRLQQLEIQLLDRLEEKQNKKLFNYSNNNLIFNKTTMMNNSILTNIQKETM